MDKSMTNTDVDVIIPAFREVQNVGPLVERLKQVRNASGLSLYVTFVDDNSQDGIDEAIRETGEDWVRLIVRKTERGLSTAVIHGIEHTRHDFIVVMDADLSHPPERIPDLIRELNEGSDFAVGSRYVEGGSTDDNWGFFRWLNSRVATILARPFTRIKDPMSGFFALRRSTFDAARDLNPIGYKIGLELIVKCQCKRVTEIPIHFEDRVYGQSKLTFAEQLKYIQHIRRLYIYSFNQFAELIQFAVVGGSGVLVNLLVLTLSLMVGMPHQVAVALAIWVSITTNFLLNRRFTFSYAKDGPFLQQYVSYVASVMFGALVNYIVTLMLIAQFPSLLPQIAALAGIVVGTILNYTAMKYLVFRKRYIRAKGR
jgi:dolichol-phosphate mannosyltransferase